MSEDSYQQKQPTLIWNTARGVWERVGMESLLCEHLEPFSATWPTEGMMRNGQVFELPTQEHRTTASESSSLPTLPTTRSQNGEDRNNRIWARDPKQPQNLENALATLPTPATSEPGFTFQPVNKDGNPTDNPNERWYHPETGRLVQKGIKQVLDEGLLRTPAASEGERGHQPASKAKARGGQQTLSGQFIDLFRTPQAKDGEKGGYKTASARLAEGRQVNLYHEINEIGTNWGKFEPAIRRWEEVLGRPAPAPTKSDGKEGNHRLSSRFTEWMMGVPEGWITDVGLTRNEELKACGNGVVPQQAELALRVLLEGIDLDRGVEQVNLPTPTVSDTFTGNLKSTQQKPGSMHSVTLPQAVRWVSGE